MLFFCREFYKSKSNTWISEEPTTRFLSLVENAIVLEQIRCRQYLTAITEIRVMNLLDEICLANHLTELLNKEGSGLATLLQNDMMDDLQRMFKLLARIKNHEGLKAMCEIFLRYIRKVGFEIVDQFVSDISQADVKDKNKVITQLVKVNIMK